MPAERCAPIAGDGLASPASLADVSRQRARLCERLDELRDVLPERLALVLHGAMCHEARPGFEVADIGIELPPSLLGFVAEVMAFAERRGLTGLSETLLMLYGESMPFALSLQLAGAERRCAWLFDTPLELAHMPGLAMALERLDDALEAALIARGLASTGTRFVWQRWRDGRPMTLAELHRETFFGGLQSLFGTSPDVLAELAAIAAAGGGIDARSDAIDELLGAALLHEFLHFGRERDALMPPYLDEAIAGAIGSWLDPRTALPDDAQSEALEGFQTFAQVGEALSDLVGRDALLLAQAGYLPWDDALPVGLRAAMVDLYWRLFAKAPAPHLHPDPDDVLPWADLFSSFAGAPKVTKGELRMRLFRAVAALGLTTSRPGRVRRGPTPPVILDFDRGLAWSEAPGPGAPRNQLIPRLPAGRRIIPATDGFVGLESAIDTLLIALGDLVSSPQPTTPTPSPPSLQGTPHEPLR